MKRLMVTMLMACAAAMAQPECSLQTLRGTYVVSYTGVISTPGGSPYITLFGVVSIDPAASQQVSGGVTVTGLGPTAMFIPTAGTVQINSDCTGVLRLGSPGTAPTEIDQFIYDADSKSLVATAVKIAAGGIASLGRWKKIFPMPYAATWAAPPKQ